MLLSLEGCNIAIFEGKDYVYMVTHPKLGEGISIACMKLGDAVRAFRHFKVM